ncbi:hypothetical protein LRAMOSA00918 [Lichtheimia ramosa]|uniref:Uncharacterized protein n=1 Tax=Lichtheimia ramosa TaxID=688394 RepID=A0A077W903_9FUNG|nr:hypothetical protein LRAMOSA00918 [Lichtheimia ramosa]
MSLLTALEEASEATRGAISFLQHMGNVHELLQDYTGDKRTISYIDHKAIRDLTVSENINDLDWVEPAVDRLNVAVCTMAMWSNNVQYDEVISNFFSLLIPKQLHDRDGIIDSFLDAVAIWTIADTRWPIDTHTTTYVVTIVKQRIKGDRKCQSPLLFQKIFNALDARFEHLDSAGLDALIINANKRMEETWFKVLPVILKAIDGKGMIQYKVYSCLYLVE